MFQQYEDIFLRDIAMLFAASIGLILLVWFYIRNSNALDFLFKKPKFLPQKEEPKETQNLGYAALDWHGEWCDRNFTHQLYESKTIWDIGLFHCHRIVKEKDFYFGSHIPWFEFSKTGHHVETIMSPIFRKIFGKYKGQFERMNFVRKSFGEPIELYTWLRNETHIRSAVFAFLDEVLKRCHEQGAIPRLTINMEEIVTLEIFVPKVGNSSLQILAEFMGVDHSEEEQAETLKLWVAFSLKRAPTSFQLSAPQNAILIENEEDHVYHSYHNVS